MLRINWTSFKLVSLVVVIILIALSGNLNQISWPFGILLLVMAYSPSSADEENKILRAQLEEERYQHNLTRQDRDHWIESSYGFSVDAMEAQDWLNDLRA